jgi:LysM repeat protein
MRQCTPLTLTATLLVLISFGSVSGAATTDGNLEQEYVQVRKIALKDPKVQEAFQKANERLNERIVEIDPALKPAVARHEGLPATTASQETTLENRPAAAAAPEGHHHVVEKGETLSSIAAHYKVKVAVLEKVNHITNDRKLQVGQKLVIPSPDAAAPEGSPASTDSQAKDAGNLWDRLKSGL